MGFTNSTPKIASQVILTKFGLNMCSTLPPWMQNDEDLRFAFSLKRSWSFWSKFDRVWSLSFSVMNFEYLTQAYIWISKAPIFINFEDSPFQWIDQLWKFCFHFFTLLNSGRQNVKIFKKIKNKSKIQNTKKCQGINNFVWTFSRKCSWFSDCLENNLISIHFHIPKWPWFEYFNIFRA